MGSSSDAYGESLKHAEDVLGTIPFSRQPRSLLKIKFPTTKQDSLSQVIF